MAIYGELHTVTGAGDKPQRRLFVSIQSAKAGVGAILAIAFVAIVGRPDVAEFAALAGLLLPAVLAALAFTPLRLSLLEQAALAIFAALIGYLAFADRRRDLAADRVAGAGPGGSGTCRRTAGRAARGGCCGDSR